MMLMTVLVISLSKQGPVLQRREPFESFWDCTREAHMLRERADKLFGPGFGANCVLTGAPASSPMPRWSPPMTSPIPEDRPAAASLHRGQ